MHMNHLKKAVFEMTPEDCYKERIRFRTPGTRGCRIPDRKKSGHRVSWTRKKKSDMLSVTVNEGDPGAFWTEV